LKVDRSFIGGLGNDPQNRVILSAIIHLARTLGMKAIAEGVETAEQLARLRELGCEIAQGNYFSEPLPGEEASELLATNLQA
jgi:EAL domain-containing protein (putative c-di-GMP-specific phosphodiesterase class I)